MTEICYLIHAQMKVLELWQRIIESDEEMSHAVNNPWVKKLLSRAETYSLQTVMKEKERIEVISFEWKEMDEPRPWA